VTHKSYPKPLPAHLAWLRTNGFVQIDAGSCGWWRAGDTTNESWYVWVHGNGGQAEIKLGGRKLTRCDSWRDTAQLERFFGLVEYAAVGVAQ
jgi:hypothetical protein